MRDFVRDVLPHIRSCSPQLLNARAELELELEIKNENATVVGGDGVKTKTGMEGVNDELGARESSESDSEDGRGQSRKEYSSWRPLRMWPLAPLSSPHEEVQEKKNGTRDRNDSPVTVDGTISPTPSTPSPSESDTSLASGLRRIRSAVSLVVPTGGPYPFECRRAGPGHIRLPALQPMSKFNPSPTSPSLRRTNASHPDIVSLVENWSHSGPANQTLLYQTPQC
jgi:hypothetical protein